MLADGVQALIDGEWADAEDGAVFEVTDPADGSVVAEVADCGPGRTGAAVDAAERALPGWRAMPAHRRADILRGAAALLAERAAEIGALMTREQGKPSLEAVGEVESAGEHLLWAAEETRRVYGETVPAATADSRIWVLPEPVGVVAAITPWNFPASMITRKLGPALAAGCTVLLKPSELTPLCAAAVGRALMDAGLPAGVFNLVPTSRPELFAAAVMADSRVRKVSFTGSTVVGRRLIEQSAQDVKRLAIELGGHAPVLVFPDADIPAAAAAVARSKFLNCGQACTSPNRIFVHRRVAEEFIRQLAGQAAQLTAAPGSDPGSTLGPLINERARAKVERHVEDALARGARVVTGGRRPEGDRFSGGAFYEPTVLADVDEEMLICHEETFGPVAPVLVFGDEEQRPAGAGHKASTDHDNEAVVARANATPYGLVAYVWTRDLGRTMRVSEALRFGMVTVNGAPLAPPQAPFGGVKGSGYGREGGHLGVEGFLDHKYLSVGVGR
ncbi:succinate-semialdehyde dehydrogenase (NADP(+)) [Streptomyces tsukubensis]|uniref:Succinate-semialdehyde dehydrogenase (NADP(+)) n=1 Tax=Streptomyces tsukubensis TaxID=83656 RepID=A0A1V4AB77_9ACTN|nr:succinate-semialdehyde dehydrogenase (NADP(+)) [Streptomyces tsukubensis]